MPLRLPGLLGAGAGWAAARVIGEYHTVYTIQCTLYTIHYTPNTIHYTLTLHTLNFKLNTSKFEIYNLQLVLYTIYFILYTLHFIFNTLHLTLYTFYYPHTLRDSMLLVCRIFLFFYSENPKRLDTNWSN